MFFLTNQTLTHSNPNSNPKRPIKIKFYHWPFLCKCTSAPFAPLFYSCPYRGDRPRSSPHNQYCILLLCYSSSKLVILLYCSFPFIRFQLFAPINHSPLSLFSPVPVFCPATLCPLQIVVCHSNLSVCPTNLPILCKYWPWAFGFF